jgi:hypothetical protein
MIRPMIRGCIGALLAFSVLAGACSDDEPENSAVTSIPDETSSTTSTTEPETVAPDVIPDDESLITEEYVQGVLAALSEASNEVLIKVREAGVVEEDAIAIVQATKTESHAVDSINALANAARNGFDAYVEDPQPARYEVQALPQASRDCIVVDAEADSSGAFVEPPPPVVVRSTLVPASQEQRASGLNSTAWVLAGSVPVASSTEDFCP